MSLHPRPPPKGTPWKLQPKYATRMDATELVHEQYSDDSNDDVDEMFDELENEQTAAIEDATKKGAATFQAFQDMVAAVQAANQKCADNTGDMLPDDVGSHRSTPVKRKWGLVDIDEDTPVKPKNGGSGTKRSFGRGEAVKKHHDKKDVPKLKVKHGDTKPPSTPPAPRGTRGRPTNDLEVICNRERKNFKVADASSVYFTLKWTVQQRCIRRYIAKAEHGEKSGTQEEREFATLAKWTFSMIESGMKIYALYRSSSVETGFQDWMSAWQVLMTFLEDKDGLKLDCPFLWQTYYDVLAELPECPHLPVELCKLKLIERGVIMDVADAFTFQRKIVFDMIASKLQNCSLDTLLDSLKVRIRPFLEEAGNQFVDCRVCEELQDFYKALPGCTQSQTHCLTPESCNHVQVQLEKVFSGCQTVRDSLLGLLLKFKDPGQFLLRHAQAMVTQYKNAQRRLEQMQVNVDTITAMHKLRKLSKAHYQQVMDMKAWLSDQKDSDYMECDPLHAAICNVVIPLAANAIGCWASRYSVQSNWQKADDEEAAEASWMLDTTAGLITALADDICPFANDGVEQDAVQLCRQWYKHHALFAKDAKEFTAEEAADVISLAKWGPLQQWLEKFNIYTLEPVEACVQASWAAANEHFKSIQEAFQKTCGHLHELLLEEGAPASNAVSEAFIAGRAVAEETVTPGFFVAVGDFTMSKRDQVADLDVQDQLKQVRVLSKIGDIETLRAEYLDRYINIVITGCSIGKLGNSVPATFTIHGNFTKQMQAMTQFLKRTVRDRWHSMECAHFKAKLQDGTQLLRWADAVLSTAGSLYTNSLDVMAKGLSDMCPPETITDDPQLLTESRLHKAIFENKHRDKLNPGVQNLQDVLQHIKDASGHGFDITQDLRQAYKRAMKIRAHAKMCIVLDWTLDILINDKKESKEELKVQSTEIINTVSKTNVTLPKYMNELLAQMAA